MVLYDRNNVRITDPTILAPPAPAAPAPATREQIEDPGFRALTGAAFRMENTIGSYLASQSASLDPYEDDGYDPWPDIKDNPLFLKHQDRFLRVSNSAYAEALKADIIREEEDRKILEAGGIYGLAAGMAAGLFDWTTLLPGGVYVKGARSAYSVGKSAAVVGAFAGAGTAVQEGALLSTQQTRTPQESLINIGAGTLVGGIFGAAGAKFANAAWLRNRIDGINDEVLTNMREHPDSDDLEAGYNATVDQLKQRAALEAEGDVIYGPYDENAVVAQAASAGAAAVNVNVGDIGYTNKITKVLSKFAIMNDAIALLSSPVGATRNAINQLAELGFGLKSSPQIQQEATGAAETRVKLWTQGAYGRSMDFHNKQFKAYKKVPIAAGEKRLTVPEFAEAVGRALRNNDLDPNNDFVSATARKYREEVFTPLMKEAQAVGIFDKNIRVKTAPSYFHRMFSVKKVVDREDDFKDIVKRWARRSFADQFREDDAVQIDTYVQEIADSIYNKITGAEGDLDPMLKAIPKSASKRGPWKERTFTIKDELIKEFLEDDVRIVAARYARIMGADVEIASKAGDIKMSRWLGEGTGQGQIGRQYAVLKARVKRDKELTDKQKAKLLKQYSNGEARDRQRLQDLRDRLRGTHKLQENNGYFAPVRSSIMAWNYLRAMGGVVVSSLSDISRIITVHGPGRFLMEGVIPLATNLKALRLSAENAKQMGAAMELVLNTRQATWAELTDPYAAGHPAERWLSAATTGFSRLSGIVHWNQFLKSWAGVMSQNRILRNAEIVRKKGWGGLSKREQRYMDFVQINAFQAETLGDAFEKYGTRQGSIYLLEPKHMETNIITKSIYEAAVIKDVDGTIVTKGIADTPLALDGPVAKMIFQFKSFALASHQRVLMRAASGTDSTLGVISGMTSSIGMGSMIYMLKQIERGEEISNNPGKIIAEGVDRSGLFAIMMELNNIAEKWNAPGFYQAMSAAFPDREQSPPASRYAIRNSMGALLGPSFGLGTDATAILGNIAGVANPLQDSWLEPHFSQGDLKAARRLAPGTTLPYFRWLVERYMMD